MTVGVRERKINVLSLFDGMAGARIALDKLGIECNYYASEVDKWAIQIAQKNYPDIIQLGDVRKVTKKDLPDKVDLLVGGSPCQGFSIAAGDNRLDFGDRRSRLFFEFVRLKKESEPKFFLLENVASMSDKVRDAISLEMGVDPIEINSSLVSAQVRRRYYWTNIPNVSRPPKAETVLEDILEDACLEELLHVPESYSPRLSSVGTMQINPDRPNGRYQPAIQDRIYHIGAKSPCLNATMVYNIGKFVCATSGNEHASNGNNKNRYEVSRKAIRYRRLTPTECERLQTVPEGYTKGVSNTQRYKMLGNGFTIDVIAHILSFANFD